MACRLIVGCGYVGRAVAKKWLERGDQVWGTTRSPERAKELEEIGVTPILWDWHHAPQRGMGASPMMAITQNGEPLKTVLISVSHASIPNIPYPETHSLGLDNLYSELARLEGVAPVDGSNWIYLSTTGVIGGGNDGAWVDERSELNPLRPGGIAAAGGEAWITSHLPPAKRLILRPAGIYGPGRIPNWQAIRDRIPLEVDPQSYLNLIHVEDLANVILFFSDNRPKHELYCVGDNQPPTREEYYNWIAESRNLPPPIFASPIASSNDEISPPPNRKSRSNLSKRVSSRRLLSELPFDLKYPSFREGLFEV